MTVRLNLSDIQGNVTRAYGRYSFPFARYFFLNISDPAAGRAFVNDIRAHVTTAERWDNTSKPDVTLNIGFTFTGLLALGLPTRTLTSLPSEFIDGMHARSHILGDNVDIWDPIWKNNSMTGPDSVHVWISMNARVEKDGIDKPTPNLEKKTKWLRDLCKKHANKIRIIKKNGKSGKAEYQSANAVFRTLPGGVKVPSPFEHFGLTDGISDPVFEGQYDDEKMKSMVIGRGKWMNKKDGWVPLATGEFILGHPDESQELPPIAEPRTLMQNGTFMVFRKLHENVKTFEDVIVQEAKTYAKLMNVDLDEAIETLKAKMVGRWSDGVPLSRIPTYKEWETFRQEQGFNPSDPSDPESVLVALGKEAQYLKSPDSSRFKFGDDMQGIKCPVGSHIRRVNTRDYLDPTNDVKGDNPDATTQLNKRRRVLRRGLPYGPTELGVGNDDTEQGVAMMMICASLERQFEFIQQQWIQYSLDFRAGNDTCPLLGGHDQFKRHTIPSDPDSGKPPFIMSKLRTFVETRGGEYFFIPSVNALRLMGMGIVDPT